MRFVCNARTEFQKKAEAKLRSMIHEVREKYPDINVPDDNTTFSLLFDVNSVRVAGFAVSQPAKRSMAIRLHKLGLEKYGDEFINGTLVHEFAHILQYCNCSNSQPHGLEFKLFMKLLGGDPSRCHNYNLRDLLPEKVRKTAKTFTYKCKCQEHQLSTIRHNRIRYGKEVYSCTKCNTILEKVK